MNTHPAIKAITFTPDAPHGWCIKSSRATGKRSHRPCYYNGSADVEAEECRWIANRATATIFNSHTAAEIALVVIKVSTNKIAERARIVPFVPVEG